MKAIGIDIGTTSICGVVIDAENGNLIKSVTRNSDAFIITDKSYEKIQSVDKIIEIADDILNSLITDDVAAIGVTGQMHGIVYVDKKGNAVSPLYTWQDGRGNLKYKDTTYAEYLNGSSGFGCITDFYNRENGIRPESAVGFCTIHDYFVMKICDLKEPVIHSSDAASFGCYNIKENKLNYDADMKIVSDYTVAGYYNKIPVSVAIGDNQASVFASLDSDDDILLNVGTGSQISVVTDKVIDCPDIETRPYFEGKYLAVGAALCGGRAYSILKDFYKSVFSYREELKDDEIYSVMSSMLNKDCFSLDVDTRFSGTRNHPEIKGSINGIDIFNFTPETLTRGFLKGIIKELYNLSQKTNLEFKGLVGSGNGIRKNVHLKNEAEKMYNKNMKIPVYTEEAACGASLFALISAGLYKNKNEIRKLIRYKGDSKND